MIPGNDQGLYKFSPEATEKRAQTNTKIIILSSMLAIFLLTNVAWAEWNLQIDRNVHDFRRD